MSCVLFRGYFPPRICLYFPPKSSIQKEIKKGSDRIPEGTMTAFGKVYLPTKDEGRRREETHEMKDLFYIVDLENKSKYVENLKSSL